MCAPVTVAAQLGSPTTVKKPVKAAKDSIIDKASSLPKHANRFALLLNRRKCVWLRDNVTVVACVRASVAVWVCLDSRVFRVSNVLVADSRVCAVTCS